VIESPVSLICSPDCSLRVVLRSTSSGKDHEAVRLCAKGRDMRSRRRYGLSMLYAVRPSRCRITLAAAMLAACGGDSRDTPIDAPPRPIDAFVMIDAAPPPVDAPSRVSVTVLSDTGTGRPDTSARVIFADPSNQLVQQGLVGTAGDAAADLPGGGLVHVVHVIDLSPTRRLVRLLSIRVRPGDDLTVGHAAREPQGAPINVDGTFTPIENVSTLYTFSNPCGRSVTGSSNGNAIQLRAVAGCLPATFDVLGTTDFPNSLPIQQFVWFKATPGGGFAAPAMKAMETFVAVINRVPVGSFVDVARNTALPPYFERAHGLDARGSANGTTVTALPFYPPPPPDSTAIGIVDARIRPTQFGNAVQVLQTRVAGSAASVVMDLEELPLPVVETAPTLSGKVVSWTQTGSAAPDLRQVTVSSTYAISGLNYQVNWTLIDGGSDSSVELPGLPTMFADFDPTQQPAPDPGTGRVLYVNYSNVDGFDAARRLPLGSLAGEGIDFFGRGLFEGQLYSVRATMH
jgi:hypothetical protein